MRSLVNIDVVANNVCERIGDHTFKHKFLIIQFLIDCYNDFVTYANFDLSLKTEVLEYGSQIELPKDFVFETKVGLKHPGSKHVALVNVKGGRMDAMTHSDLGGFLNTVWSGDLASFSPLAFYNPFYRGGFIGELYGFGRMAGHTKSVHINRSNGVIELGSDIPYGTQVVVEYQSDGLADGLKLIPREAKLMHTYFALREWHTTSFSQTPGKASNFNALYEQEMNKVVSLYNYTDAEYLVDAINSSMSPTNY